MPVDLSGSMQRPFNRGEFKAASTARGRTPTGSDAWANVQERAGAVRYYEVKAVTV